MYSVFHLQDAIMFIFVFLQISRIKGKDYQTD